MVGRSKERDSLKVCLQSGRAEFLVVYGRRRIGKTYLIKEYFNNSFSFYATGVSNAKTREQLKVFNGSLIEYGGAERTVPGDWFEAFSRLKALLQSDMVRRDPLCGRRVVFLDELPWMDTARSDFKSALEYFWNNWASTQNDILLIVCGSATSWIIDNLLGDRGGFYNRITRQIHLMPFTLGECEEYYSANNIAMTRRQMMESYMIFGGVPYYLNCFDKRLSLAQNVDELLFKETGQLYYEYDRLLGSLFKNYERHSAIVEALSHSKGGITRAELSSKAAIGSGELLTKSLRELEQCGFIRQYQNYKSGKYKSYYQLVDPFVLFCFHFIKTREHGSWLNYINTPSYYSWAGNAFETVCLLHIKQIKKTLGISGVETREYSWRSRESKPGAQVDLIIDRKDETVNLVEMKFASDEFTIDAEYEKNLRNKLEAFRNETGSKKALHITMLTSEGLKHNEYSGIAQYELTADDLFG